MTYSEFLFTQLFYSVFKTRADVEYDLIYPIILSEYEAYDHSEYNTDTKGEYQCMVDYLQENKKDIILKYEL